MLGFFFCKTAFTSFLRSIVRSSCTKIGLTLKRDFAWKTDWWIFYELNLMMAGFGDAGCLVCSGIVLGVIL